MTTPISPLGEYLTIETIGSVTQITNYSKYKIILSSIPIKPKRAFMDLHILEPGRIVFFDFEFDLTKISFRFEI